MSDEGKQPKKDTVIVEHFCEQPGCEKWGGFGFAVGRAAPNWFCFEHKHETWPPARQQ